MKAQWVLADEANVEITRVLVLVHHLVAEEGITRGQGLTLLPAKGRIGLLPHRLAVPQGMVSRGPDLRPLRHVDDVMKMGAQGRHLRRPETGSAREKGKGRPSLLPAVMAEIGMAETRTEIWTQSKITRRVVDIRHLRPVMVDMAGDLLLLNANVVTVIDDLLAHLPLLAEAVVKDHARRLHI